MPISHRHQAIFIHIPKTGGTSIEALLGMHGDRADVGVVPYTHQTPDRQHFFGRHLQHMTGANVRAELNDENLFASYFKFTVVRNPWERLVSTCAWSGGKWARGLTLEREEFDAFARRVHATFTAGRDSADAALWHSHLLPQVAYVFDAAGRSLVDFVGRFESLQSDWRTISRRLGVDAQLPTRMKSFHHPYQDYYDGETRDMVADVFAEDIDVFSYQF